MSSQVNDLLAEKSTSYLDDENRKLKKQKDYMPEILDVIPSLTSSLTPSSSTAQLESVITELLAWEKKARLAFDSESTKLLAETILDCCVKQQNWTLLNENIILLSKRRCQLIKVVKAVVVHALTYLPQTPNADIKRSLISTLRQVSDGKIFLELERAELTKLLASMYEEEGDIARASDTLQTIAVETVGSMPFMDRAYFLLEQLRLCIAKKDWLKAELTAKKLASKQLSNPAWTDVRIKLNMLMIQFYEFKGEFIEICRCWNVLFDIHYAKSREESLQAINPDAKKELKSDSAVSKSLDSTMSDSVPATVTVTATATPSAALTLLEDRGFLDNEQTKKWQEALEKTILYCFLAPIDYDSKEIATRLSEERKALGSTPAYAALLESYTSEGIISWPLRDENEVSIEEVIHSNSIFSQTTSNSKATKTMTDGDADVKGSSDADNEIIRKYNGNELWTILRRRVIQKNLVVVSTRYSQVSLLRLGQLNSAEKPDVESALGELITNKQLVAKINSPEGIVTFSLAKNSSQTLNNWSENLTALLALVDSTANLIQKENMIFGIKST